MRLARTATVVAALVAALAVLAISLAVMLGADRLTRLLGVTGTNVINRLLGVVLGALAVQFVVDGIRASFGVMLPG